MNGVTDRSFAPFLDRPARQDMFSLSNLDTDAVAALFPSGSLCRTPDPPEKIVRIMAGSVTLTGLALGTFVHPTGYLLTAFAGMNILQSAFTGFCPPELVYRWWTESSKKPAHGRRDPRTE